MSNEQTRQFYTFENKAILTLRCTAYSINLRAATFNVFIKLEADIFIFPVKGK